MKVYRQGNSWGKTNMLKFKPLRDYILVKPLPRQDSAIIHVVTKKKMHRGEVKAVGNGRLERPERDMNKRPLDVKEGDIINYGDTPLKFPEYVEDGNKYLIMQESDIGFIES